MLPQSDHFTHAWSTSPDTYVAHYQKATPKPDILTASKLTRIMERYDNAMSELPNLKDGQLVNRRNFDAVERRDVLSGLIAYSSMGEEHQDRLIALYQAGTRKPFGDTLDIDRLKYLLRQQIPASTE